MVDIGYALSSEELKPHEMVEYAQRAEDAGFKYLMISDTTIRGSTRRVRARSRGR